MAKIWFEYEGDKGTHGDLIAIRSLRWCVDKLGLTMDDWKCTLGAPSDFPTDNPALDAHREPIAVIFEVDTVDLMGFKGWQTGYYIPPLRPVNVQRKLSEAKSADASLAFNAKG